MRELAIRIKDISIHALREEGDGAQGVVGIGFGISIHALREEGDPSGFSSRRGKCDFYPRPPRGGRRRVCAYR